MLAVSRLRQPDDELSATHCRHLPAHGFQAAVAGRISAASCCAFSTFCSLGAGARQRHNALDLAYLVGKRPADTLKLSRSDIRDGAIELRQNKTRQKLRVEISEELAVVMRRIEARKALGISLVNSQNGQRMSKFMLRTAFETARD